MSDEVANSNAVWRPIHLLNHLSINQKMALILHCVEKDSYSVFILCRPLEYADKAFKRAGTNLNPVSRLQFLVPADEPIPIYLCPDETDHVVIDRNRTAAEADHVQHASRVIDLTKLPAGIKVGKDVTGK